MSIINEALKKAGKQHQPLKEQLRPTLPRLEWKKGNLQKPLGNKWVLTAGTALIIILSIILADTYRRSPLERTAIEPVQKVASLSDEESAASVPGPVPNPPVVLGKAIEPEIKPAKFTLNGILFDGQNPLAIINGRVLATGAMVEGALVKEIQPDSVKLTLEEKEIILAID